MLKLLTGLALATTLLSVHAEPLALGPLTALDARLVRVRVEDAQNHRPLPVYAHDVGRGYVAGNAGQAYQLVVDNLTEADLLVVPSVDGVNALTGQTAASDQSGYIVPARGSVRIDGWRKSLSEVAQFYFTAPQDSYASRTGRPASVGVIGFAVFEQAPSRWASPPPTMFQPRGVPPVPGTPLAPLAEDNSRARVESMAKASGAPSADASAAPSLGTGHGDRQHSEVNYRNFVRRSSRPNEFVSLEYDSLESLRTRGILAPLPGAPRPRRGFPGEGFVFDPPSR